MIKKYRRFTYIFLTAALSPLLAIGFFNGIVDPYGIFNRPKINDFNQIKPKQLTKTRMFKSSEIIRKKPKTILLGSSRVDFGLDPTHPDLLNPQSSYNLGILGGNIYELRRYLDHAIANQPNLQEVILGIDFFMFNEHFNKTNRIDVRLGKTHLTKQDILDVIFSVDAIEATLETLSVNQAYSNLVVYSDRGMRNQKMIANSIQKSLNFMPKKTIFSQNIKEYLYDKNRYKDYQKSSKLLSKFQSIIELCKQNKIKLNIFISPIHASQLETIKIAGLWPEFEKWKREVVTITPLWDFSGYNSITSEPISESMKNFLDSAHYSKEVGDLILSRILDYGTETVPDDFGVLLTPDNIEAHLEKIRGDRELWVKNNPEAVQLLLDIKSEVAGTEEN